MSARRVRRGVALVPAVAAVGLLGAEPAEAQTNGQGDPLRGDLNGDGHVDRATSVPVGEGMCGVRVELSNGFGGYHAPDTHTYPAPGTTASFCPDMGVIVDLGGDGVSELVLAWFAGRPPGVDSDLLVLRDYVPAGGFEAIRQPSGIGLADFDGDGLTDLYEVTDQGEGFRSYLNQPDGQLVPGPVAHCGATPWNHELADVDGDGAMDLVVAVDPLGCYSDGPQGGVEVVLDDGTVVGLQGEETGADWSIRVIDHDDNGIADVETTNGATGEVTIFMGDGDGTFNPK